MKESISRSFQEFAWKLISYDCMYLSIFLVQFPEVSCKSIVACCSGNSFYGHFARLALAICLKIVIKFQVKKKIKIPQARKTELFLDTTISLLFLSMSEHMAQIFWLFYKNLECI